MKRYTMNIEVDIHYPYVDEVEAEDGAWVKYEEAKALDDGWRAKYRGLRERKERVERERDEARAAIKWIMQGTMWDAARKGEAGEW